MTVVLDFETPATGSGDKVTTSFGSIELFGVHYSEADAIDVDLKNAGYGGTVLMNANQTDETGTSRIEIFGGLATSINFHYGQKYFPPDLFPSRGSLTAYTYARSLSDSFVSLDDQYADYVNPPLDATQPVPAGVYKQFSLLDGAPIEPPSPLVGPGIGYFNSFRWTSGTFAGNVFKNSRPGAIQIDGVTLTVEPVKDILGNIHLDPQSNGHGIRATFSPQGVLGAVHLADLAYASGFSHFNWISQVTAIPESVELPLDKQGHTLHPPFNDPPPGGFLTASGGRTYDSLPYYIDVPGYGGDDSNLARDIISDGTALMFQDTPQFPTIQADDQVYFQTTLVGVKRDHPEQSVPLYSFTWSSNYNGGTGGVTIWAGTLADSQPEDGIGGVTIIDPDVDFADLPPSIINSWVASGFDLTGLPLKATDDVASTAIGSDIVIPVLSNDFGTVTVSTVSVAAPPSHGSAVVDPVSGRIRYTPSSGYFGSDSIRYTVRDASGAISNEASVSILVLRAPLAGNDAVSAQQGLTVKIDVLANDSATDGALDPSGVTIVQPPQHGSVAVEAGTGRIVYTPASGYLGPDDFTYRVSDEHGIASNAATVTLSIIPQVVPKVLAITRLDGAPAGRLRVAVDFSVAMDPASAADADLYAIAVKGGAGLVVLSASYSDAGGKHRATVEAATAGGGPLPGGSYEVRVDGARMKSAAGVPMATASDRALVLISDSNSVVTVGLREDADLGALQASSLGTGPPLNFVARDFDGDGVTDVVIASAGDSAEGGGRMAFLRGLGGGRFADAVVYRLDPSFNAIKVVAADWDGDGDSDLVLDAFSNTFAGWNEKVYVFLNDGAGRFTLAANTPFAVEPALYVGPSIEVADVLPNSPGPELVMYLAGNYNPYGGIAAEGKIQIVGKDPFLGFNRLMTISLGENLYPTDFQFADFNEDGRTDILINGAHLMVLLATATGFAPAQDVSFQHASNLLGTAARVGDVDGDGHADIVLAHEEYSNNSGVNDGSVITVIAGDGRGHFTQASRTLMNRRGSTLLDLKDMDSDGKPDLLLGETWSDGPGGYAGHNWPDVDGPSAWIWKGDGQGRFIRPTGDPVLLSANPGGFVDSEVADVDGDGDFDALFGLSELSRLVVMANDGRGRLEPPDVPGPYLGTAKAWGGSDRVDAIADGDLNRDGVIDLVKITSKTVEILIGQRDGGFRPRYTINVSIGGTSVSGVALGDLNGDGVPDVVAGGHHVLVLIGRGDGSFEPAAFYGPETDSYVGNIAIADVNRDGELDVIGVQSEYPDLNFAVYFGDGTGKLFYNPNTRIPTASGSDLTVADFDGDGKVDIVDTTSGFKLLHGNGDGTFTAAATSQIPHNPGHVKAADLNGDGRLDLIGLSIVNNFLGEFYTYLNDGEGHFTETFAGPTDGRALTLTAGDFDDDGKLDVLIALNGLAIFGQEDRDAALFYRGDGLGGFEPFRRVDLGGSAATAAITQSSESAVLAGSVDVVGASSFGFSASTYSVDEAGGKATITVTRTGDLGLAAGVSYAARGGTATAGADYTAASGTLAFAPGVAKLTFNVPILGDGHIDPNETVGLTLSAPTGPGASLGATSSAALTIVDDDSPVILHPGTLRFESSTATVGEAGGPISITVVRDGGSDGTVSVSYSTGGGAATAGTDYDVTSGSLSFGPGVLSKSFLVPIRDDLLIEGDETFAITLTNPLGGATLGTPAAASVTIVDDDHAASVHPGTLQFLPNSYSINENQGPAALTVVRSGGADGIVTVRVTTSDITTPTSLTLTFAPGETVKTVFIPILHDGYFSMDRFVLVTLSTPTGGAKLGASTSASLTIHNVDSAPAIPAPAIPAPADPESLVSLVQVQTVAKKRKKVTQIIISLNGPVDPAQAANLAIYRLATAGRKGSFDAKGVKKIKLRSAAFNPSDNTLTLTLAKPLKISKTVQLRIDGVSGMGLTDSLGRLIDGNRDGQAGGNAVALISKRGVVTNLSRTAGTISPAARIVDALFDQDAFGDLPHHARRGVHGEINRPGLKSRSWNSARKPDPLGLHA